MKFLNSTVTTHRSVTPHSHTGYSKESNAGQFVGKVLRGEFQMSKQVPFQLLHIVLYCVKLLNAVNTAGTSPGVRSKHRGKRSTKPGIGSR